MAAPASDRLRHFRLLLWNHWTEFNKSWHEARSQRPLPSLCFSGRSEKQDGRLASYLLRYFRLLLWNRWMEFNETWQEARSKRPLPSLCFSGRSEKQHGHPGLWLAETFSTSPLKPLNRSQWNLIGSKISTPSTKFVFFGPIGKTKWPPWSLIGWDIFDFSSETAERNSAKLDRNKLSMPSTTFVFFRQIGKKHNGRPGLWLAETFSTFPLKPLKGIRRNLIGSKISTPSTKFVFFRWIGKTKWPPRPMVSWYIFTFPLKPLNRIQQNLTGSKISTSSTRLAFFGLIKYNTIQSFI